VVDRIHRGDEVAFNATSSVHAVTVIDLNAQRNTGGDGNGLPSNCYRSKYHNKKEGPRKNPQDRQLHYSYRPAHWEKVRDLNK
jgi:hypothetical protein